ncbi:MAG: GTP-binding protein [Bacteroidales bacterium]|nr:GTP-binding protein [Candidatus Hennigimonas equi]
MKMMEIPVLLLTGYLGSGKTTLVNKILGNRKGIKFAVIVNDIGEVNIDASLIQKDGIVGTKDDSLVALQNGCICCTLKMDLVQQITDIVAMGRFDYLVIEASGICEPEPIARTICSIPYMGEEYTRNGTARLDCIVTVVDARRMRDEFSCAKDLLRGNLGEDDIESLVIQQVEFCNVILLNKASEISAEDRGKVKEIIRQLQPKAGIVECDFVEVDFDSILNTGLFDYDSVAGSAAWIEEVEKGAMENEEEGESEEYGIGTYVYFNRRPLDINKFDEFVARRWPAGIIRAKGMCYFSEDIDQCYIFEQAGAQIGMKSVGKWYAAMPEDELRRQLESDATLRRDWDERYGDRMQKLVFIGQHLDRDAIREALDFCLEEE